MGCQWKPVCTKLDDYLALYAYKLPILRNCEVLHVLLRPLLVLSTILISIASTFTPFQLSPGFFRWGYAIPAHELYQVLIEIWSDGCNNRLYHALPILFSWWISLFALSFLSLAFKCHRCVREQKQKSTELELKVVE